MDWFLCDNGLRLERVKLIDELDRTRLFFKKLIKQNCFKFCCIHYEIYLILQIYSN